MKKIIFLFPLLLSCAGHKVAVVENVSHDTIYQMQMKYDSVHIDHQRMVDARQDTIYISDHQTEYRYRLLHDTTYIHRVDTIPHVIKVSTPTISSVLSPYLPRSRLIILILALLAAGWLMKNHRQ